LISTAALTEALVVILVSGAPTLDEAKRVFEGLIERADDTIDSVWLRAGRRRRGTTSSRSTSARHTRSCRRGLRACLRWDHRHDAMAAKILREFDLKLPRDRETYSPTRIRERQRSYPDHRDDMEKAK